MTKNFKDRLEVLEALEIEREQDPAAQVDQLTPDALLTVVVAGIRGRLIIPGDARHQWLYGVDAYWRAVAARTIDVCVERSVWVNILRQEEIALARAALDTDQWLVALRDRRKLWYDFSPPTPYPDGCWETPEYQVLELVALALRVWFAPWSEEEDLPLPETNEAVSTWLATFERGTYEWGD